MCKFDFLKLKVKKKVKFTFQLINIIFRNIKSLT